MRGFTLIELSIVLIIIGLLVGGVLAGRDLIRQAELSAVGREHQAYLTSIYTFYTKYNWIPGDMDNAEDYFGASNTDNGDADNVISNPERHLLWQHLSLAGLIDGTYTGAAGAGGGGHAVPGVNCPASSADPAGWSALHHDNSDASSNNWFAINFENTLTIGAEYSPYSTSNPAFTPAEAFQMDTKYDDGVSTTGDWVNLVACTDADDNEDLIADYDLSSDDVACAFRVMTGALNQ